jgi:hypothetical protein
MIFLSRGTKSPPKMTDRRRMTVRLRDCELWILYHKITPALTWRATGCAAPSLHNGRLLRLTTYVVILAVRLAGLEPATGASRRSIGPISLSPSPPGYTPAHRCACDPVLPVPYGTRADVAGLRVLSAQLDLGACAPDISYLRGCAAFQICRLLYRAAIHHARVTAPYQSATPAIYKAR